MKISLARVWVGLVVVGVLVSVGGCAGSRMDGERGAGHQENAGRSNRANTAYGRDGDAKQQVGERVSSNEVGRTTGALAVEVAPQAAPANTPGKFVEVFPSVLIDRGNKVLVLSGTVPIEATAVNGKPAKPVYLEVLVCSRDTKEHEALVVVNARPSHVHAALLMLGLEPGTVGTWREEAGAIVGTAATGPELDVKVRWKDGDREVVAPMLSWVVDQRTQKNLLATEGGAMVFAGSRFARVASRASPQETFEAYMADIDGTLVGLTTFSSECIAWTKMHHHQSKVEEPRWIANPLLVPKFGTEVEVVITAGK
ncbi:MAG: YdjY domain-containing protein [Phycisphaerales bacterium]